jgi:predicted NBD/HSP70 family sugar kinase
VSVSTVTSRACERCGRTIAGRADRRYCSSSCRTAAHRAREAEHEALDWLEQFAALVARAPARALEELAGERLARGGRGGFA